MKLNCSCIIRCQRRMTFFHVCNLTTCIWMGNYLKSKLSSCFFYRTSQINAHPVPRTTPNKHTDVLCCQYMSYSELEVLYRACFFCLCVWYFGHELLILLQTCEIARALWSVWHCARACLWPGSTPGCLHVLTYTHIHKLTPKHTQIWPNI